MQSETHIPFENQLSLRNGFFSSLNVDSASTENDSVEESANTKLELSELKRQVLFLQGQLEDKEKTVMSLQNQVVKLVNENEKSQSAPASAVCETSTSNAATQTERVSVSLFMIYYCLIFYFYLFIYFIYAVSF